LFASAFNTGARVGISIAFNLVKTIVMADITTKTTLRNDYTPGPVTASFLRDADLYYASFFHEATGDDNGRIRFTGRILVVMLHPGKGTVIFYLKKNGDKWEPDLQNVAASDYTSHLSSLDIDADLLEWCNSQINQLFA
jgi:hypothetical protein